MQTPYIIVKRSGTLDTSVSLGLERRQLISHQTENFSYLFFPPEKLNDPTLFTDRIHCTDDELFYEDGFLVEYPDDYIRKAVDKRELFFKDSRDLDGFFSRVVEQNGVITIDGSALYLQMMFSYCVDENTVYSNSFELMVDFLKLNNVELKINELFFASHLFNYSLAYYMFAGTPYRDIEFHDSLETITINKSITAKLCNKFGSESLSAMEREKRLDHLHGRLSHCIDQYCQHYNFEELGHNLTGGRDSRVSLSLFMQSHKDKLLIDTGGFNYTQDKVISSFICEKYGLRLKPNDEQIRKQFYDYRNIMEFNSPSEAFIPMFKKISFSTRFKHGRFVASGYLGNVVTFSGGEGSQILRNNPYELKEEFHQQLTDKYDAAIDRIKAVYGDQCYAIFNIMYNTTNKVASVRLRLRSHTLCIFELDVLQSCYFMEDKILKKSASIHYELLKRSNEELLTRVPFENNKSFEGMDSSFELPGFKQARRPDLYRHFVKNNFEAIVAHLKKYLLDIPFVDHRFIEKIHETHQGEITTQVVHKIYAALGALEFRGIRFSEFTSIEESTDSVIYSTDLFKSMYLDSEVYASGLAPMVYQSDITFKSYIRIKDNEKFVPRVVSITNTEKVRPTLQICDDGYLVSFTVPEAGKYNVVLYVRNLDTAEVKQVFDRKIIVKLENQSTEAA